MKCKQCGQGKRFADGSVYCIHYGMIIREDHECGREGAKLRGRDADNVGNGEHKDQLPEDEWGAIDALQSLL